MISNLPDNFHVLLIRSVFHQIITLCYVFQICQKETKGPVRRLSVLSVPPPAKDLNLHALFFYENITTSSAASWHHHILLLAVIVRLTCRFRNGQSR